MSIAIVIDRVDLNQQKFGKSCHIFISKIGIVIDWMRHDLVCTRRHRLIYFNKFKYSSTRRLKVRPVSEIATNQLLLKFLSKGGFDQLDKSLQRRLTVSRFSIFSRRVSIWLYTGMLNVTSFAFQLSKLRHRQFTFSQIITNNNIKNSDLNTPGGK